MNFETKKQMIILVLAFIVGIAAVVFTGQYIKTALDEQTQNLAKEYEKKQIQPLKAEINDLKNTLNEMKVQQNNLIADLNKKIQEIPTQAMQQQPQGQGPTGTAIPRSSLAIRTPGGKRAYTVMIDSLAAVGGLINPGDYVDVLGHLDIPDPATAKTENVTSVIFQNLQILAVGTNLQSTGGYEAQAAARSLNVTFALDPEQIGLISFSQRHGTLQLVLRPPTDTEVQMLQASSWNALSSYVLEKQGTELVVPRLQANIEPVRGSEEVRPYIQIFKGGTKQ